MSSLDIDFYRLWQGKHYSFFKNTDNVKYFIARYLREKTLNLCVGSGISLNFKLPTWRDLINRCIKGSGIDLLSLNINDPNLYLKIIEIIEKKANTEEKYLEIVYNSLYEFVDYDTTILNNQLLKAFSCLINTSPKGYIDTIISFNFDDIFEYYLSSFAYSFRCIYEYPSLISKGDIYIFHPHGFLPKNSKLNNSSNIILSRKSYLDRMTDSNSPWNIFLINQFLSKLHLFIGLSGNDPNVERSMHIAYNSILHQKRPLGVQFFKKDLLDKYDIELFFNQGIIPVLFNSFEDYPKFLMDAINIARFDD
jgi:hypothetical protein